jgi:hypothetical protein
MRVQGVGYSTKDIVLDSGFRCAAPGNDVHEVQDSSAERGSRRSLTCLLSLSKGGILFP